MVRPDREQLGGRVEVDQTYVDGSKDGVRGRQTKSQALVLVAVEEKAGKRMGRIRIRRGKDASADSLHPFVCKCVAPGSVVHTDGWQGYRGLDKKGYQHQVTVLASHPESASELLYRVHRGVALLKQWLGGTHQRAVSHQHLDYYLDQFTFRFNRRTSGYRGKLFYRLLQNAVAMDPTPYQAMVKHARGRQRQNHSM